LLRIPYLLSEINLWLKPTQALSSAWAKASAALRAACKYFLVLYPNLSFCGRIER
jgi:hypothetical protein